MKLPSLIPLLVSLASAAPSPAGPYTDPKSGITFSAFSDSATGYFFGLALPPNTTERDFIATLGGKGTGWSGVSLGGAMLNKLLIVAWPNGQEIVSSFRKTAYVFLSPFSCLWHFRLFPVALGFGIQPSTLFKSSNSPPQHVQ